MKKHFTAAALSLGLCALSTQALSQNIAIVNGKAVPKARAEALAQQVPQGRLSGPLVALTLDLDVDLGVCGYLLPAAERLAQAGISIVPQCAFKKDHLLVPQDRADEAERVLQAWIEACR